MDIPHVSITNNSLQISMYFSLKDSVLRFIQLDKNKFLFKINYCLEHILFPFLCD